MSTDLFDDADRELLAFVTDRLKAGGQWRWSRGRPPHPPFIGARAATERLLQTLPSGARVLVMRDQCLFDTRVGVLASGRTLLVPDDAGKVVYRIPRSVLKHSARGGSAPHPELHIDPLPFGSELWTGPVDVILVACTAFSRDRRQLWSLDWDISEARVTDGVCCRDASDRLCISAICIIHNCVCSSVSAFSRFL